MTDSTKKKKNNFDWKSGAAIKSDEYNPLGNVRDAGFNKISNALYVDPELRKKERVKNLTEPKAKTKNEEFLIEQSSSGISDDFSSSNAEKLIGKPKKFTGLDRFKTKK